MSALIGVAIIGIWLIVLVPIWLNRHDAEDANRSMDSFSAAMRVLSRRAPAAGDRGYVLMPRRDNLGVTVDNNPDAKVGRPRAARRPPANPVRRQASSMARRRRVAASLLGLLVALGVTCALGITAWWYELAVGLATAGYFVHLRNEAIRARELRRRRVARVDRADARWRAERADDAGRGERAAEARGRRAPDSTRAPARPEFEPVANAAAASGPQPNAPAASASGTENGSRWEPVPVPLPTYVSKPVVSRPAASAPKADVEAAWVEPASWPEPVGASDVEIDHRHLLDETGSGRVSASPGAPPAPEVYEEDELDVILRRRAVGD